MLIKTKANKTFQGMHRLSLSLLFATGHLMAFSGVRDVPFSEMLEAQAPGAATTMNFTIKDPGNYTVAIGFTGQDESSAEALRLASILGAARRDASGQWVEPGVPATFSLQLYRLPTQELVSNQQVERPKTRSMYKGRLADLLVSNLLPGEYRIEVTCIASDFSVSKLQSKIYVSKSHHGK